MGLPVVCWYTHTPLCPFFWLSSLSVAPSADSMSARGALRDKHMMHLRLSFLKNVTFSILNCTVHFVLFLVPLTVYSPI
jgi:hypothetical protein